MNTAFLLVLLTLADAGQINAAFVNTDSLIACQTKSNMLGAVISVSGTKVVESRCFTSTLTFSKFSHEQVKESVRSSYLISLADETVNIKQSKNKMACIVGKEKLGLVDQGEVYCTTSSQHIIRDK